MTEPLVVELEQLPSRYFEKSCDWSDLFISRVLCEPLFVEAPNRGLATTSLVEDIVRVDDLTWQIHFSEVVERSFSAASPAEEVGQQVRQAARHGAMSAIAASFMASLRCLGSGTLEIKTKFPTAHMDRILAHPGLAPHNLASVRRYQLIDQCSSSISLQSNNTGQVLLLKGPENFERCDQARVIRGPMALPPRAYAQRQQASATHFDLDICYALSCPSLAPKNLIASVEYFLDRDRLAGPMNGSVSACSRFTNTWTPCDATVARGIEPPFCKSELPAGVLRYSPFPGNEEFAESLIELLDLQFGLQLRLQSVPYSMLNTHNVDEEVPVFRLVLVASPWPHPVASIAPYYFGSGASSSFKEAFVAAARETDLGNASMLARRAEDVLTNEGRLLIALARAKGCVWPVPESFFCAPSGWLDLEALMPSEDR